MTPAICYPVLSLSYVCLHTIGVISPCCQTEVILLLPGTINGKALCKSFKTSENFNPEINFCWFFNQKLVSESLENIAKHYCKAKIEFNLRSHIINFGNNLIFAYTSKNIKTSQIWQRETE
jgi:hypothetical protein